MVMTKEEILSKWRRSDKKKEDVQIIADLNGCRLCDIEEVINSVKEEPVLEVSETPYTEYVKKRKVRTATLQSAKEYILNFLVLHNGKCFYSELRRCANEDGISTSTMARARDALIEKGEILCKSKGKVKTTPLLFLPGTIIAGEVFASKPQMNVNTETTEVAEQATEQAEKEWEEPIIESTEPTESISTPAIASDVAESLTVEQKIEIPSVVGKACLERIAKLSEDVVSIKAQVLDYSEKILQLNALIQQKELEVDDIYAFLDKAEVKDNGKGNRNTDKCADNLSVCGRHGDSVQAETLAYDE